MLGTPQTANAIIVKALDNTLDALGDTPWGTGARGVIVYNHSMLGTGTRNALLVTFHLRAHG